MLFFGCASLLRHHHEDKHDPRKGVLCRKEEEGRDTKRISYADKQKSILLFRHQPDRLCVLTLSRRIVLLPIVLFDNNREEKLPSKVNLENLLQKEKRQQKGNEREKGRRRVDS